MMLCPNCGRELEDNVVFCDGCGARINKKEYVENVNNEEDFSAKLSSSEDKKNKFIFFMLLYFSFALSVIFFINYVFIR